jgi:hypothetical protein
MASLTGATVLDKLAGDPLSVDLTAEGPWMPAQKTLFNAAQPASTDASALPLADSLTGSVTLHNANWKADYLVSPVLISSATLHLNNGELDWEPVIFSYGPVKGTASLSLPANCGAPTPCQPSFTLEFGSLDASLFQAAFLGAQKPGTLVSTLLDRLRPTPAQAWPRIEGTVKADSLLLGQVTLRQATATLRIGESGAEITSLEAGLLGGHLRLSGALQGARSNKEKPAYTLQGNFEKLNPQAVCPLLGLKCAGSSFDGNGKLALSGFTSGDLAASAKGALHFEWRRGRISTASGELPPALARFDRWTADASIANGGITLQQNQVQSGGHMTPVAAAVSFGTPSKTVFTAPPATKAKR